MMPQKTPAGQPPLLRTALPSAPPRLTPQELREVLAQSILGRAEVEILRWLVWLSLLSSQELSLLITKANNMRVHPQTVRGWLEHLEALRLVDHVICQEAGWTRHHRYYLTDWGIHALIAHYPTETSQQISVAKLAKSYPITRMDLLTRLARLPVHLVLAGWVTRLIATCPVGYALASYQQPWIQFYTERDKRHFWQCDAAFLLTTPNHETHAFYVSVDSPERLFGRREGMASLLHLLHLRMAAEFRGEYQPPLLICTTPARFPFWAEQLVQVTTFFTKQLPKGAIADISLLSEDPYGAIWRPFQDLVQGEILGTGPHPYTEVSLLTLLNQPAMPTLIERFSQHASFQTLLQSKTGTLTKRSLQRYVADSLQKEAHHLLPQTPADYPVIASELTEEFYGAKAERTRITALLSLLLTAQQKTILALLARHPWLALHDILVQMQPAPNLRRLQGHLHMLITLGLIRQETWPVGRSWQEQERYYLTETALRYLAVRHNFSPAHYLFMPEDTQLLSHRTPHKQLHTNPTQKWIQRGASMMQKQKLHTHGLYCCIRQITLQGRLSGSYEILFWRSARESVRFYQGNGEREEIAYPRPDAELLYRLPTTTTPKLRRLLIEYDRGTSWNREYLLKFAAYTDYQNATHQILPPILLIVQSMHTQKMVDLALAQVHGEHLPVLLTTEGAIRQFGLQPLLSQLAVLSDCSQ